jgi:gas vesicle protein
MNNDHHNGHFFDGFLLGLIVGSAAVFLFGTKSGKNLLKILSDQGIDGLRDLIEEYSLEAEEEEFEDESSQVVEELKQKESKEEKIKEEVVQSSSENLPEEVKPPKKRFFKRFKK